MITESGAANGAWCSGYVTDFGRTAWAAGAFCGSNNICCSNSGLLGSLEPGITAADGSPGLYDNVWMAEVCGWFLLPSRRVGFRA